ncbi:hypothetical protein PIB30_013523 [Stylosanthes scabra]|uniref:CCHC-type domain-containing protein n=1 Tax=Stylosanthes scabra TaxID=79078 RepID=A0ABU6R6J6_9FABA|nr:hypothetical protein [Stylosanthes scabra]
MDLEMQNGLGAAADPGMPLNEDEVAPDTGVRDPARVRTKGTARANDVADGRTRAGPKRRKCSACGRLGHRRTRCPNVATTSNAVRGPVTAVTNVNGEENNRHGAMHHMDESTSCCPNLWVRDT